MRQLIRLFMVLLIITLMLACSQETPPVETPAKPVATEPKPVSEQAGEAVAEVKQQVKEAVAEIKQEAVKQVEAVKEKANKQVDAVKEKANKQVDAVKVEAAAVIEQTKTSTIGVVDKAKQGTISALAGLTAKTPAASPVVKGPDLVVYEASQGKVTFNHAEHSSSLDCNSCHQTDPPQKIAMTKTLAHSLCKDCHKASGGDAPTACTGCHKK